MDIWVQKDGPQLVRDDLRRAIPEPGYVRADMPAGWTPADGPRCTVQSDGTTYSGRGHTKELVRVTVHAQDGPAARRIMQDIDGYLVTPAIHRLGYSISPATGIIAGPDSRLGGWVSSATYGVTTNRKVS